MENLVWKESSLPPDSSSSETGKDTPPEVQFTLGDDESITTSSKGSLSREKTGMIRSFSHDTTMASAEDLKSASSSFLSKSSLSDNSLDLTEKKTRRHIRDLPTVMSVDDETLSTDSNSTADNDELKRRRRKLFPGFRKNKGKTT